MRLRSLRVFDVTKTHCDTKVGEFDGSTRSNEEIGALDVTVDDSLIVQVAETVQNLIGIVCSELLRKLSITLHELCNRPVLDVSFFFPE